MRIQTKFQIVNFIVEFIWSVLVIGLWIGVACFIGKTAHKLMENNYILYIILVSIVAIIRMKYKIKITRIKKTAG